MRSEARTARSALVRVNRRAKLPRINSIARFGSILGAVRFSELCGRSGHQPSPKQDPGGLACQFICAFVFARHALTLRPARVGCPADPFDAPPSRHRRLRVRRSLRAASRAIDARVHSESPRRPQAHHDGPVGSRLRQDCEHLRRQPCTAIARCVARPRAGARSRLVARTAGGPARQKGDEIAIVGKIAQQLLGNLNGFAEVPLAHLHVPQRELSFGPDVKI